MNHSKNTTITHRNNINIIYIRIHIYRACQKSLNTFEKNRVKTKKDKIDWLIANERGSLWSVHLTIISFKCPSLLFRYERILWTTVSNSK